MNYIYYIFSSKTILAAHFITLVVVLLFLHGLLDLIFTFFTRLMRHKRIMKHGYPAGTDADGDFPDTFFENEEEKTEA